MNKTDLGMGLGMAAAMAICCGGHLLLLALVASGVAIFSGQTVVIAAAVLLALAAVGAYAWRRRTNRCAMGACSPPVRRSTPRSLSEDLDPTEAPSTREPVAAGHEARR